MAQLIHGLLHSLSITGIMTWQIVWSLLLGFMLSAVIQSVVRRALIVKLLGNNSIKTIVLATGFGIASSSCSYAAVAIARSLFRQGASFLAAMVFEIASTNLIVELGILIALLIGWQFTLAEFFGGPLMIILLALGYRIFLRQKIIDKARAHSELAVPGLMEGHAAMDMTIQGNGSIYQRLISQDGITSISHIFVMEMAAVWKDIVAGLLIAGAIAAWVPAAAFRVLFLASHPLASRIWGPVIGPLIAIVSFVCSIGNVPLAAVLWSDGISFGGVISFLFADLLIIPILLIYRKYYGTKMTLIISFSFYVVMVIAGWVSEAVFGVLHLIPSTHHVAALTTSLTFNYTTVLDSIAILVAVLLVWRFIRSGALPMLKMMEGSPPTSKDKARH